ncbi:MAG: glycosyltransferase family 2 protein [Terriglobia bacterium]
MMISVVIPVFNEAESLRELSDQLDQVARSNSYQLDVFIVDDGSIDNTWSTIQSLALEKPWIHGIRLRRNFGKTAALSAGFSAISGQVIVQMDGDLQDDPAEIPKLIKILHTGFDLVNGWKRDRKDPWHKILASRVFNWTLSCASGLRLHDHNCGLKCFRREVLQEVHLYGERHRFIPLLANAKGFRVIEVEVRHRKRPHGRSKYGVLRLLTGALDVVVIVSLMRFTQTPFHLFGVFGFLALFLGMAGLGFAACLCGAIHWAGHSLEFIRYPKLFITSLAVFSLGGQILGMGFLAEWILSLDPPSAGYSIAETTKLPVKPEEKGLSR